MLPHLVSVVGLALAASASALTVLADGSSSICLAQDAIQTASLFTGQEADAAGVQPGQAKSSTQVSQHSITDGSRGQ